MIVKVQSPIVYGLHPISKDKTPTHGSCLFYAEGRKFITEQPLSIDFIEKEIGGRLSKAYFEGTFAGGKWTLVDKVDAQSW